MTADTREAHMTPAYNATHLTGWDTLALLIILTFVLAMTWLLKRKARP